MYTHYTRLSEGIAAVDFVQKEGWMPTLDGKTYGWDEIPQLVKDYAEGRIDCYFSIYFVNGRG